MGMFENLPYTNFQRLNMDWILKEIQTLRAEMDSFDADMQTMVNNWLNDHPEATTTVLDGSLTEAKFSSSLKLSAIKDYVTPQMYGAVGDGVTDDGIAIQNALNAAQSKGVPMALISNYYCDRDLTVPSYVRVTGLCVNTERKPMIEVGPNVTILFSCGGIVNAFDNFDVRNDNATYRGNTMFDFLGNSANDIDSVMKSIEIGYCEKAVVCRGRNLAVEGCLFSHCAYGLYYDLPNVQIRGLTVRNCNFHGIGEEAALNWFENSACIYIDQNYYSNLLVENCISEQSGTFIQGTCTHGLIVGNFVESYKAELVHMGPASPALPGNTGCVMFIGNSFNGKAGTVAVGIYADYPKNIFIADNFGRMICLNNTFRFSGEEMVKLTYSSRCTFKNNAFLNAGLSDPTKNVAFLIGACPKLNIIGNMDLTDGMDLISSLGGTTSVYSNDNTNFSYPANAPANMSFLDKNSFVKIGTITGSAIVSFDLPQHFFVHKTGDTQFFEIWRNGDQFTTGFARNDDSTCFLLFFTKSGDDYYSYLKRHTWGSAGATAYASTMDVYVLI